MAEPAGFDVRVVDLNTDLERSVPYDAYMLREGYIGALFLGLSLNDPWMRDFRTSHTPAVLYDNIVPANPTVATLGMDNNEAIGRAVAALYAWATTGSGYLSSALGSHIYQVRYKSFFQRPAAEQPAGRSLAGGGQLLFFRNAGHASAPPAGAGGHGHPVQFRPAGPHRHDPLPGTGPAGAARPEHRRL